MLGFLKRLVSPRERLRHLLGNVDLPVFPAATHQVLTALRDPRVDANRLGALVERDPGITMRVLKMANSPAFGLRKSVTSVPHAVSMLGRGQLETLVLAAAVNRALPKGTARGFDAKRFWRAAARRGATARAVAELMNPAQASNAFVGGLLQDLAVPLLAHHHPDARYAGVLEQWHGSGGSLGALERSVFGWSHADVGGWLCEDWGFPNELAAQIEGHHDASRAMPAVVLVSGMDEAKPERATEAIIAVAHERFGVKPDAIKAACERGREHGDELGRVLAA